MINIHNRYHQGFTTEVFTAATVPYHRISSSEAYFMMNNQEVTVIDVRQDFEYELGHIPGAILIPDNTITDKEPKELPDKNAAILIYCRTGVRSLDVAFKLIRMGYTNIYDFGGIVDWPYETTRD